MNEASVTSIVSIFLDVYRPELAARHGKAYIYKHSLDWTKRRIEFFRRWVLKSLRNQSFKDFRIFILCSEKSRGLIDSYNWDSNITHCYDYGKAQYASLHTDYVSITRLDTDDLLRFDGMETIQKNLVLSDKIERLFFSDYYTWLFHHDCFIHATDPLTTKNRTQWSPSYTLIFPKALYKDWLNIKSNYLVYAPEIYKEPGIKVLPPDFVCSVRIKDSTHHAIWNEDVLHKAQLKKEIKRAGELGREVIFSPDRHVSILKDFGISREQYLNRSQL